jgi:hypothetical protein
LKLYKYQTTGKFGIAFGPVVIGLSLKYNVHNTEYTNQVSRLGKTSSFQAMLEKFVDILGDINNL